LRSAGKFRCRRGLLKCGELEKSNRAMVPRLTLGFAAS
jgi:hypothetical protein